MIGGFATRISQVMETFGFKRQYELASALGLSKTYINEIIQGKKPLSRVIEDRMKVRLAINPEWLREGTGEMLLSKNQWEEEINYRVIEDTVKGKTYPLEKTITKPGLSDEFVYIPQVSGKIAAGKGEVPDNRVETQIAFRRDWIVKKGDFNDMSLIKVAGDSMEDTLLSGDLVLVDHSRNYLEPQGGIYALCVNDDIMIKRLERILGTHKVKIISDNRRYEPIEMESTEVKINGKVIWFGRELERE